MKIRQNLDSTEEVSILTCTSLKVLTILFGPPVCHITILIIMASLIIKSVCHLMSNHHTDSSIIEGIIGLRVKEWILKNTCRETNLICRRIIISIHRLWGHQPFILINRLTSFLLNSHVSPELTTCLNIIIKRL